MKAAVLELTVHTKHVCLRRVWRSANRFLAIDHYDLVLRFNKGFSCKMMRKCIEVINHNYLSTEFLSQCSVAAKVAIANSTRRIISRFSNANLEIFPVPDRKLLYLTRSGSNFVAVKEVSHVRRGIRCAFCVCQRSNEGFTVCWMTYAP